MKRIVNILLCLLLITLLLFSLYQARQLTRLKVNLGQLRMKNFYDLKAKTFQIYSYIKEDELDIDTLVIYVGESRCCIDMSQRLEGGYGPMLAYSFNISNRLEDLSDYIKKDNPDEKLLMDKKEELAFIFETLKEVYEIIENENGEDAMKWYNNYFNRKYSDLYMDKINEFFNEKARENKILEIY